MIDPYSVHNELPLDAAMMRVLALTENSTIADLRRRAEFYFGKVVADASVDIRIVFDDSDEMVRVRWRIATEARRRASTKGR